MQVFSNENAFQISREWFAYNLKEMRHLKYHLDENLKYVQRLKSIISMSLLQLFSKWFLNVKIIFSSVSYKAQALNIYGLLLLNKRNRKNSIK